MKEQIEKIKYLWFTHCHERIFARSTIIALILCWLEHSHPEVLDNLLRNISNNPELIAGIVTGMLFMIKRF
jgi:hypothetical protein